MKTLTALALAGILTLGACTQPQQQTAGELLMFSVVGAGIACGLAKVC